MTLSTASALAFTIPLTSTLLKVESFKVTDDLSVYWDHPSPYLVPEPAQVVDKIVSEIIFSKLQLEIIIFV